MGTNKVPWRREGKGPTSRQHKFFVKNTPVDWLFTAFHSAPPWGASKSLTHFWGGWARDSPNWEPQGYFPKATRVIGERDEGREVPTPARVQSRS